MTNCDEVVLSEKFLAYLNVKDQITLDLLISWMDIALWFLPGIKCRANVLHLLEHGVPQQCITILTVELNLLLHLIWDLYPELVSLQPILGLHFRKDAIPLL